MSAQLSRDDWKTRVGALAYRNQAFIGGKFVPSISGKTFQYTRPDGNGFVTYNADGTFSFQDDAKGGGMGKWSANGTQFCETWGKNPPECGVFKNTGDAYFAAKSRLVEMKT